MYRALRQARPDVAHFHDPELIPVGILLRLSGTKVIYDVHEDLPRQILSKPYIPAPLRRPIAGFARALEWLAGRLLTGIVPATPAIAEHFPAGLSVLVQNFPLPGELTAPASSHYAKRPPHFAYVGGISEIRGTGQMVEALQIATADGICLRMAGVFLPAAHRADVEALPGWRNVDFIGWADRPTVATMLGDVRAGLVLFGPYPNHISAQPNKLFEYMGAGLPVIASDFPLWRQIVDGAGCGLLVNPEDPKAIAEAMDWLLNNPDEAEAMGKRGQRAVEEIFNWPSEAKKLVAFYHERLGVPLKPEHSKGIT